MLQALAGLIALLGSVLPVFGWFNEMIEGTRTQWVFLTGRAERNP
jgi:hypothetical protein